MKYILTFLLFFSVAIQAQEAPAQQVANSQQENTYLTLLSEYDHLNPNSNEPLRLAVLVEPRAGWHIYWENPGDSGLPPTLKWDLPKDFKVTPIEWPAPHILNEGPLATYAYDQKTLLPVRLLPSKNFSEKSAQFKAHVDLLVCKDICIPESADLYINLPVSQEPYQRATRNKEFSEYDAKAVRTLSVKGVYSVNADMLHFTFPREALRTGSEKENILSKKEIDSLRFFIRDQNVIQYATAQSFSVDDNSLMIAINRAEDGLTPKKISGILTLKGKDGINYAFELTFDNKGALSTIETKNQQDMLFPIAFLLAIIGGLILNLMPCVLPILSLKAVAIIKKNDGRQSFILRQGIAYTIGILVSFAIISGLLLALRAGGESVGWGYQMQSPAFVGALIYLLFLVGLSLSGVFHLPVVMGNVGSNLTAANSTKSSFFTGVLATAVATPCTAPFMAPAIGAALTMPAWKSLLIFQALGFGLALPFLLISIFPPLRAFLPKPGAWMETFKQLMAFPMYASVIWLLWVLTLQTGVSGMVIALSSMLSFVVIIWARRLFTKSERLYPWLATGSMLFITIWTLSYNDTITQSTPMPHASKANEVRTIPYQKDTLQQLRSEGKAVWVDATAAWCITCQVNARVALHTDMTMKTFHERDVTLMIADWTRRSQEITDFLAEYGYNGVPLNVYYPPNGGEPVILPQLLSEDIILRTLSKSGELKR